MYPTPEQFVAFNKACFDTATRAAGIAINGFERLTLLQMAAAKSAFQDGVEQVKAAAAVRDPAEFARFKNDALRAAIDKTTSYAKSVYEVGVEIQSAAGALVEEKTAEFKASVAEAFDKFAKSAPAGSEAAVAAAKSAMSAVNSGYDNFSKSMKQFVELTQNNVEAAAVATQKTV